MEQPLDVRDELEAARQEHAAALAEWNRVGDALSAIERFNVLPDADQPPRGNRVMRAGGIERPKGRELDKVEREVAVTDLRRRHGDTATALVAAKARLGLAQVAHVNERLPALAEQHQVAANRLLTARKAAERAAIEYVACGIVLLEAAESEELAHRRSREAALAGATDQRSRDSIKDEAGIPVRLNSDGTVAASNERPSSRLWNLGADSWRIDHADCSDNLGRTIANGRRRLGDNSERVEDRFIRPIQRRLAQLDDETRYTNDE
jgi:hypothetical protein